jgi:DNA-binding MarR family transcriptional regulator
MLIATTKDSKNEVYELMARMGGAFHRARRKIPQSLEDAFQKGTLNTRHISVLNAIACSGPMSVSALAECIGLSLSATSQLVAELTRAEFIERHEDPSDRRTTIVSMSSTHGKAIFAYVQFRAKPLLRVLERVSEKDGAVFLKCIRHLLEEMGKEGI